MTENKRYEFDVMNGGGYVVGYSERMNDDISLIFTRLCEVPTKTQAEKVCNELKGLQKEIEQLKSEINMLKVTIGRNEAHIKRLTEKINWRTSAYD